MMPYLALAQHIDPKRFFNFWRGSDDFDWNSQGFKTIAYVGEEAIYKFLENR